MCQVFHAKLQALLHNLKSGKYFGPHKQVWIVHVIEYQQRGLPHAHIILRLSDMPSWDNKEAVFDWIDTYITCIKCPEPTDETSEEDRLYHEIQGKNMMHDCRNGPNGCLNERGYCRKHFNDSEKPTFAALTSFRGAVSSTATHGLTSTRTGS
jgi:hypothetical protein